MILFFQFCDTFLEVPLIIINVYHLELTPESYNKKILSSGTYKGHRKPFQTSHNSPILNLRTKTVTLLCILHENY